MQHKPNASKKPCADLKVIFNRPKPDMLHSIIRSKANPDYNARRLWYELNMPECTSDILDGKMLSADITDSLMCLPVETKGGKKKKNEKKKKESQYTLLGLFGNFPKCISYKINLY